MSEPIIPNEQKPAEHQLEKSNLLSKIKALLKHMPVTVRISVEIGTVSVCLILIVLFMYPSLKGGSHKVIVANVSNPSSISQTAKTNPGSQNYTAAHTEITLSTAQQSSTAVTGHTQNTTKAAPSTTTKKAGYSGPLTNDYDFMLYHSNIYQASANGKFNSIVDGSYKSDYDDPVAGKGTESGVNIQQVIPDGEWLYYVRYEPLLHNKQLNGIFRCRADGSENQLVIQGLFPSQVYISGDQFIYLGFPNNSFQTDKNVCLYTINKDGSNRKPLCSFNLGSDSSMKYTYLLVSEGYAYLIDHNSLLSVSLSSGTCSTVLKWADDETKPYFYDNYYLVSAGWIYYYEYNPTGHYYKLKRIRTNGKDDTTLVTNLTSFSYLAIHNGRIYFVTENKNLLSVPVDGSSNPESVKNGYGSNLFYFSFSNNYVYIQYTDNSIWGIFRLDLKTFRKTDLCKLKAASN